MAKKGWKIHGLDELLRDFKQLPILKQARIIRNLNRRAANKIIVPRLTQAIPHKTKKVRKRTKANPFKIVDQKQVITVNEKGSKTAVRSGISGKYFHYRFLEFGTKKRTTKNYKHLGYTRNKFGKRRSIRTASKMLNRGAMPKKPFAGKALDRSIIPLIKFLKTEYSKMLHKYLKK